MELSALERFNTDYKIVRAHLLKGKWALSDAKAWLRKHGVRAATEMQEEFIGRSRRLASMRADRELEVLRRMEAEGREDE